jgi:hypothetical protein
MGVFAWFAGLVARTRRAQYQASRWNRESLAPTLRVKRLEDRRVLNADAVPVDQLVVDAGGDGGDGQADTFHIEQDAERVRVSVNGQEVANAALSEISGISIRGSLDDDILMAEFKGGEPLAGLELLFDGGEGGNDSLTLGGEASVDEINYSFGESGENRIQINSVDGSAQISYRGIEAVDDQLIAADRGFHFESDGQDVTLDDAGTTNDGVSRLVVTDAASYESDLVVSFRNPSESLVIDNSVHQEETDSVSLAGLDSGFDADLRVVSSGEDALSIGGSIGVGHGDVDLVSGSILLSGRISSNAASVSFTANHEIYIGANGGVFNAGGTVTIEAPNIEQDGVLIAAGGQVKLDSGDGGVTIVRGIIDVSQNDASRPAGTVHLLGSYVGLFDNAQVYAAAALGGGTVLIGGDYQGKNPAIRNAARTYVGANAVIRADAQVRGDGGKVVVWADEVTRFYGTISARGGSEGGDGGFAEVSGKESLDYRGFTDLRSDGGAWGNLLVDPKNINIVNLGLNVIALNDAFTENVGATANFDALLVVIALAGANVELQANTDITVLEAIDATGNNNPGNLTLRAGRSVIIQADIAIEGNLTVTANDPGAVVADRDPGTGQIVLGGGAAVTLNTSDVNGNVVLNGPIVLNNDTTINAGAAAGFVTLNGTVDSEANETNDLTVTTGTGAVTLTGAVGSGLNQELGTLIANTTGTTAFNSTVEAASLTTNAGGTTQLNGNVTTSGAQGYNDDVRIDNPLTLQTTDSPIDFAGTVNSQPAETNALTLLSGTGNITFTGAVGGTTPLGAILAQSTGITRFNSTVAATSIETNLGGTTQLNDDVTTTGIQTYNDNVRIDSPLELTATNNDITFAGTVDSQPAEANDLTVDAGAGNITFTGAVGATTPLGAILAESTGTTRFNSTVVAASLETNAGGTTQLNGNVTTSGVQTYNDNVRIDSPLELMATDDDITFAGTVDSQPAEANDLTVDAGTGNITFTGAVGATTPLGAILAESTGTTRFNSTVVAASLETNAGGTTQLNGNVTTSGIQTYNDNVRIDSPLELTAADDDITFAGTVDSQPAEANDLTVDAGTGNITFTGAVGATTPLGAILAESTGTTRFNNTVVAASLETNAGGTTQLNGNVTTTAAQEYNDNVRIDDNITLQTTDNPVTFAGTLDSEANETNNLTVTTGNGNITFTGAVGSGLNQEMGALAANTTGTTRFNSTVEADTLITNLGGTTQLNGNVTTSGIQTYNDDVRIDSPLELTAADDDITFIGTVNSQPAEANDLTVDAGTGNITFTGAVGATTPLGAILAESTGTTRFNSTVVAASLETNAGGTTQLNGNVTTTGAQEYNDNVRIDADIALQTTDSNLTFAGTVDSEANETNNLALDIGAGDVTFNGAVGSGVNQELGAITITDADDVTFESTVEAASLVQLAGTGTTRLRDNVTTTAAAGVDVTTAGTIALDGLTIATNGGLARFNGDTVLEGSSAVVTTGGNITFTNGTVRQRRLDST